MGHTSASCINLCGQQETCKTVVYQHSTSPKCLLSDKRREEHTILTNGNYHLFEKDKEQGDRAK